MPPRRSHTKSRHGCDRCRRRRIKCDEGGPPCTNCVARNAECQYSTGRLFQRSQYDAQSLPNPVPQGETCRSAMGHGVNDSETRLNDEPPPSFSLSPNRMRELELMHQWCMKTCHSFSSDLSDVFGTYVVQQALHHPFLMDALLALSSLHIANDLASANTNNIEISTNDGPNPASTEDYIIDALHYQNQAAPAFRAALEHISPSNCNALFACSAIMMACAVISSFSQPGENTGMGTLTALLPFIKGVHVVIDRSRDWLASGPFGLVMQCHLDDDWLSFQPEDVELLPSRIREIHRLCSRSQTSDVCTRAVVMLAKCYVKADAMALPWLVVVGDEFARLVQEGRPMALLICMCWGVLLNRLEGIWWAKASGRKIVAQLVPRLVGAEEWGDIVNWAKEETSIEAGT